MKLNNTQDHSLICRTQFQQQSRFKLDPQRFLNWDLESFTTFQDAFDPFFLGSSVTFYLCGSTGRRDMSSPRHSGLSAPYRSEGRIMARKARKRHPA